MKRFYKWIAKTFAKKTITNATIKDFIHEMNYSFSKKVKLNGKEVATDIAADISKLAEVRFRCFSDDGSIGPQELLRINAEDDRIIDKYFSDKQLKPIIERMFA